MRPLACGAGAPARERLEGKVNRAKASAILAPIKRLFTVFVAALREILDESAYERFLARAQLESSPAAYRDFLSETQDAKARRPKCC